jgi:hypothetical protein
MNLTLKEMTRLRDKGITGFTITDKPQLVAMPDLDAPYFAPMWALGNEMGAVFNFHIGSGIGRVRQSGVQVPEDPAQIEARRRGSATAFPDPDIYRESFGPQHEYFHDHFLVSFWFEKVAPTKTLEDIGIHNVVVETDIPHPTCTFPQSRQMIANVMGKLDPYPLPSCSAGQRAEAYGITVPTR